MEFARPHLFWLFLIYIPLIFWYVYKIRKIDPTIQASTLDAVKNFRTSYRVWLRHGLFAVRLPHRDNLPPADKQQMGDIER